MKTYLKTLLRMFKKHVTRFISIILMVLVSVGFVSGIGSTTEMISRSMNDYYINQNVSDLIIKSTDENGFTDNNIKDIEALYGIENINVGMSIDINMEINGSNSLTRLYFLDFEKWSINVPNLEEGEFIKDSSYAYSEVKDNHIIGCDIGDVININFNDIINELSDINIPVEINKEVTISGIMLSPLTFVAEGEPSYKNPDNFELPDVANGTEDFIKLDNILYLSKDIIPTMKDFVPFASDTPIIPMGDIYITLPNREIFNFFSSTYEDYIDEQKKVIESMFTDENGNCSVEILSLYENYSFYSLKSYTDKVKNIAILLMFAFTFVTALVVLSNMTRLLEEERGQIACLKTLGYSSFKILFKYFLFSILATIIGGVASYFVGLWLASFIYYVFNYVYVMPPIVLTIKILFFAITLMVIVAATIFATFLSGLKMMKETPANLLRPKAPKAGKSVLLEKIPFLWKRITFKYKSTIRNVMRYKSRFFMTIISVAISMSLVMAGLSLLDICISGIIDSIPVMLIAIIIIIFAGLLTGVVIYTLTNINISERNRELATLMVLGYHDVEVSGYIYREIFIDSILGALLGYPFSALIILVLFDVLGMGNIGDVSWYWWLVAPAIIIVFTGIVALLLRRKIVGIDMNESLKAIE